MRQRRSGREHSTTFVRRARRSSSEPRSVEVIVRTSLRRTSALPSRSYNRPGRQAHSSSLHDPAAPRSFRNVLIIRGQRERHIRAASPCSFRDVATVATRRRSPSLERARHVHVAGERAAVLICYEQLLTWPILASMWEHPTALIAVANDHWSAGTTIPQAQLAAVRAWARLNAIPYVSATNF